MKSYSQAGQDRFAFAMANKRPDGVFLDVGCHDGFTNSNTFGLEQEGWTGLLTDIIFHPLAAKRKSPLAVVDALTADWKRILDLHLPHILYIDYLSLDVDDATSDTLEQLLQTGAGFACITVEHDKYRLGCGPQDRQRGLLLNCGYDLVCSDVIVEPGPGVPVGGCFEDWYINPEFIPKERADQFRCHAQLGRTIIKD